jgi:alkyl hydroperoxide reductase subunit AhpC
MFPKSSRLLLAGLIVTTGVSFAATVGSPAPDFQLTSIEGKPVKLSDFKGKHVVLEWHNPHCPFVMKHYDSGNMQSLQNKYDAKDTIWLTINSTNTGHQDYMNADKLKSYVAEKRAAPDAYLTDVDGKVGVTYRAKTTPHMYVINPTGTLIYAGAIDDKRSSNKDDIKTAKNFLVAVLDESRAGKAVTTSSTIPYGCSVKYR